MSEDTIAIAGGEKVDLQLAGLCFRICKRAIGDDGGPSIEVLGDPDAAEPLLRFDLFRGDPHFHVPAGERKQRTLAVLAGADAVETWLGALAQTLPELIREAGDAALAERCDAELLGREVGQLRDAIANAPEPGEPVHYPLTPEMRANLGI